MNLQHRNKVEQTKGTIKCISCEEEFSADWNLNNHMRDKHEKINDCQYFKKGDCRCPQEQCWKKHTKEQKEVERYTCKNTFRSKN